MMVMVGGVNSTHGEDFTRMEWMGPGPSLGLDGSQPPMGRSVAHCFLQLFILLLAVFACGIEEIYVAIAPARRGVQRALTKRKLINDNTIFPGPPQVFLSVLFSSFVNFNRALHKRALGWTCYSSEACRLAYLLMALSTT